MRKQRNGMRSVRYRDSQSESDEEAFPTKKRGTRSRPRLQKELRGEEEQSEESFIIEENGESEQSESKDGKVDLNGKLNLVYDRVQTQTADGRQV